MAEVLTVADFRDRVGERFMLTPQGGEPFEVVLTSCEELPQGPSELRVPFSLVFHHEAAEGYWPQHIFAVTHPEVGALELFLVPIGPDARGMQYQAVFT